LLSMEREVYRHMEARQPNEMTFIVMTFPITPPVNKDNILSGSERSSRMCGLDTCCILQSVKFYTTHNLKHETRKLRCLNTGWTIGVRSPTGAEDFSSSPCVQTLHPSSYPMGTGGGPFPGGKARPGRDADHSPPSCAEVKNE
jgi:hypothetical protein